jgi:two-component system, NarL family, sensor histidine kinase DevS
MTATEMLAIPTESRVDAEYRALLGLAAMVREQPEASTPIDALQQLADLARTMTDARYAALAVTDDKDRTEGFVTSGLTREELRGLRTPPQAHGPLGSLRGDGRPVRIDDLEQDPHSFGFPPRHPSMKALLGVPIWVAREVRGSLYVTDKHGTGRFDDDDEAVLCVLARHAGNVIERHWY